MMRRFEYKFVRLGEGFWMTRKSARKNYQDEIEKYAREGWRLVQIFAPGSTIITGQDWKSL